MNREIKFRAFVKKTPLGAKPNKMRYELNKTLFEWEEDGVIMDLMQYTGLKDRHGKEIYEGDIVFKDEEKCVIRFNLKEGVVAAYPISGNANFICSWGWNEMEVIGNIHENPELLK